MNMVRTLSSVRLQIYLESLCASFSKAADTTSSFHKVFPQTGWKAESRGGQIPISLTMRSSNAAELSLQHLPASPIPEPSSCITGRRKAAV